MARIPLQSADDLSIDEVAHRLPFESNKKERHLRQHPTTLLYIASLSNPRPDMTPMESYGCQPEVCKVSALSGQPRRGAETLNGCKSFRLIAGSPDTLLLSEHEEELSALLKKWLVTKKSLPIPASLQPPAIESVNTRFSTCLRGRHQQQRQQQSATCQHQSTSARKP